MEWAEAKSSTLKKWYALQEAVGRVDPQELMEEINVVCGMCEKAQQEASAHGEPWTCRYCLAFQALGGCEAVRGLLTESVMDQDWDQVRELMANLIGDLEALEVPNEHE